MKRSILEQSWAVAKPRHAGAAYNRRARTVALVTSWREEVGSPWALSMNRFTKGRSCLTNLFWLLEEVNEKLDEDRAAGLC